MQPYVFAAVENDYEVEFVEPGSKWWKKIAPLLANKGANEKDIRRAADMLAGRSEHGVPAEAIYRMLQKWHVNPSVDEMI